MASHRCKHCTLVRCDAPDSVCDECVANGAGRDGTLKINVLDGGKIIGSPVWSYSFAGGVANPVPAPTATQMTPYTIQQHLLNLPLKDSAYVVSEWLDKAFKWTSSQKGDSYWQDVYSQLYRMRLNGTP